MKTQIFLQARMGSTRLSNKALLKIRDKTIIELIVERLKQVKNIDKIILTTSSNKENNKLVNEAKRLKIDYFQGGEENILDRFYQASLKFRPDAIVRVTGDCPLIDFNLISDGLDIFMDGNYDMVSNACVRSYPDGMDFEIFSADVLKRAWSKQKNFSSNDDIFDKKFINPIIAISEVSGIKKKNIISDKDMSDIRLTMDYKEDYHLIKIIYENLYKKNKYFTIKDVLKLLSKNSNLLNINKIHNIF